MAYFSYSNTITYQYYNNPGKQKCFLRKISMKYLPYFLSVHNPTGVIY